MGVACEKQGSDPLPSFKYQFKKLYVFPMFKVLFGTFGGEKKNSPEQIKISVALFHTGASPAKLIFIHSFNGDPITCQYNKH